MKNCIHHLLHSKRKPYPHKANPSLPSLPPSSLPPPPSVATPLSQAEPIAVAAVVFRCSHRIQPIILVVRVSVVVRS